jgi:hypothetical protein
VSLAFARLDPRESSLLEISLIRSALENRIYRCTKSGHAPVNGLHSIENTSTYKARFFIDEKIRKRRTESFFDSFSVFPVGAASGAQAKSASASRDDGSKASEGL